MNNLHPSEYDTFKNPGASAKSETEFGASEAKREADIEANYIELIGGIDSASKPLASLLETVA